MPQDKFPVFYTMQARAFTATMLVASGTVRNNEIEQAKPDGSEAMDRCCKTCKCRHPKNKHSAEGKKHYAALKQAEKEKAKATMDTGDATNATSATKEDGPRPTHIYGKDKCYQCDKEHFPFVNAHLVSEALATSVKRHTFRIAQGRRKGHICRKARVSQPV